MQIRAARRAEKEALEKAKEEQTDTEADAASSSRVEIGGDSAFGDYKSCAEMQEDMGVHQGTESADGIEARPQQESLADKQETPKSEKGGDAPAADQQEEKMELKERDLRDGEARRDIADSFETHEAQVNGTKTKGDAGFPRSADDPYGENQIVPSTCCHSKHLRPHAHPL